MTSIYDFTDSSSYLSERENLFGDTTKGGTNGQSVAAEYPSGACGALRTCLTSFMAATSDGGHICRIRKFARKLMEASEGEPI
jgi:hypothetical protein